MAIREDEEVHSHEPPIRKSYRSYRIDKVLGKYTQDECSAALITFTQHAERESTEYLPKEY